MKKFYLILPFSLLFLPTLYAQRNEKPLIRNEDEYKSVVGKRLSIKIDPSLVKPSPTAFPETYQNEEDSVSRTETTSRIKMINDLIKERAKNKKDTVKIIFGKSKDL